MSDEDALRRLLPTLRVLARDAVAQAARGALAGPLWRPGTTGSAAMPGEDVTVRLDGDTNAITAVNLASQGVAATARVMVLLVPPHGAFITAAISAPRVWTVIDEINLTADDVISFQTIPTAYTHLRLSGSIRSARAVILEGQLLRFNNDSTALYDYQQLLGTNATPSAFAAVASTAFVVTGLGDSAAANVFSLVDCLIPNYSNLSMHKQMQWRSGELDVAVGNTRTGVISGKYRSLSAIDRIDLYDAAGGTTFTSGSRLLLEAIA